MICLDPKRFRFCQRFASRGERGLMEHRNGVRVDPRGYWATNGCVMVIAPCETGMPEPGETLVAPPLPRRTVGLSWEPDGRWIEVTEEHGRLRATHNTTVRYRSPEPAGAFPKPSILARMTTKPCEPTAEALLDTGLLSLFPGHVRLVFHGDRQPVDVIPDREGDFPWAGVIMLLSDWNARLPSLHELATRMQPPGERPKEMPSPPHPSMQQVTEWPAASGPEQPATPGKDKP